VIWKKDAASDNDTGRCLVGEFNANYPGYEFYYYQGNIIKADGTETDINTKGIKGGCSMAIWFDGSLIRQQMEDNIINSMASGRTYTIWRHGMSSNNDTKGNPGWYGDFLGDWREEVIFPDETKLKCIKIFSTWYPSSYKFPYLMSDHNYFMQTIHQQVGYNQPNHIGGYYLGVGMDMSQVPTGLEPTPIPDPTGIREVKQPVNSSLTDDVIYDLSGRRVQSPRHGIYLRNGRKILVR